MSGGKGVDMRILWTKYSTPEDGQRWFCIWRQDEENNIYDACHIPIG